MSFSKTIGILGGMGPSASAAMYQEIIQLCQEKYHAVQDTDYPKIILYSLPLVGFDETGIIDAPHVLKQLHSGIGKLVQAGCDCIVMACNTVHVFFNELQAMCPIPIVHMVEETAQAAMAHKLVGVLSSETTAKSGLYQQALQARGIGVIMPNTTQQKSVTNVITNVMAGAHGSGDVIVLQSVCQSMFQLGATAIVLGCTELPLVLKKAHIALPLYNAVRISSRAVLHAAQH